MTLINDWKDDDSTGNGWSFAGTYGPYLAGVSLDLSSGRSFLDKLFNKNKDKKETWKALLVQGRSWFEAGFAHSCILDERGFITKKDAIKVIEDKIKSDAKAMLLAAREE